MSAFAAVFGLLAVISSGLSEPENERPTIRPEYLDMLLKNKEYDLFAKIMDIPDVNLVRPNEDKKTGNPMFNEALELGDILPARGKPLKDESRQAIRFDLYPSYRWSTKVVPFYIAADQFTDNEKQFIVNTTKHWNSLGLCVRLIPYSGESDYVYIMNGNGCWSYIGRIGGEQSMSLQRNWCVDKGTVLHEFQHACGFAHEHNRLDRDKFVNVLWDNIADQWKKQYEKTDSRYFGTHDDYDYYSLMHYPMKAPGSDKDAFELKANGIDTRKLGKATDLTQKDINKIKKAYC